MPRLVGLALVLIVCSGCPMRWQRVQHIEHASTAMRAFYAAYPDATVETVEVVPSPNRPARYRIRFTLPTPAGGQTIEIESDGTMPRAA